MAVAALPQVDVAVAAAALVAAGASVGASVEAPVEASVKAPVDPDRQLLAAVAGGDEVALAVLLARHQGILGAVAARWTGDRHEADVVVADVHLAVWQHAGRYVPRTSVRAWLLGIARNKARQVRRTHLRRLTHEMAEELPVDHAAGPGTDPVEVVLGLPRSSGLGAAFDALPARLQEPLRLLFDQRMTYAEIAVVLDLPVGTVKRRVFEARTVLGRVASEEGLR